MRDPGHYLSTEVDVRLFLEILFRVIRRDCLPGIRMASMVLPYLKFKPTEIKKLLSITSGAKTSLSQGLNSKYQSQIWPKGQKENFTYFFESLVKRGEIILANTLTSKSSNFILPSMIFVFINLHLHKPKIPVTTRIEIGLMKRTPTPISTKTLKTISRLGNIANRHQAPRKLRIHKWSKTVEAVLKTPNHTRKLCFEYPQNWACSNPSSKPKLIQPSLQPLNHRPMQSYKDQDTGQDEQRIDCYGKPYKLARRIKDSVAHIINAVILMQPLPVRLRFLLKLLHNASLQPLYLLVKPSRLLQQRPAHCGPCSHTHQCRSGSKKRPFTKYPWD